MYFLNSILAFDAHVNTVLYLIRDPLMVKVFFWVTMFGDAPVAIAIALVISFFLWLRRKKIYIIALWFTIIGSEGCTFIAKIIFHRARPMQAVFLENGGSFPSGHATTAFALYGFIAYLLLRFAKKKIYYLPITLSGLIVILGIGFSRLYLGVHYVSDIIGGYVVGTAWLIAGIGITKCKAIKDKI